jgi:serine/threonine protein kinase
LRLVGQGGYGEVWMARNALGTLRAVKVVWRKNFAEERPYEREFHGIGKFEPITRKHEGLIDLYHVGRNDEDGYFYYVMELADDVAGGSGDGEYRPRTLREELRAHGRLPVAKVLEIGAKLASALDHLRRAGLVHRDIKPSNIIFVDGVPGGGHCGCAFVCGHGRIRPTGGAGQPVGGHFQPGQGALRDEHGDG